MSPIREVDDGCIGPARRRPGYEPGSTGRHPVLVRLLVGAATGLPTGTRYRDTGAPRPIRLDVPDRLAWA